MGEREQAWKLGEQRHEQCRYGVFSDKAYHMDMAGNVTPITKPLCAWKPSENWPPIVHRLWGGDLEFDRDCAVCQCFDVIRPTPGDKP